MIKRIKALFLALLLLASFCIPVTAMAPRILSIDLDLDFEGTTVISNVDVLGNNASDEISATIKLFEGSKCIRTWPCEANGILFFSQSTDGVKGEEYTLVAVVTVNGVTHPLVSVSGVLE